MFSLHPDLAGVLARAVRATTDVGPDWLSTPRPGTEELRREVHLGEGRDLARCASALLQWELHRASGLLVASDGPAAPGSTVVLALRLGPVWAVAPCRVLEVFDGPTRRGFSYATLPGHPEHGIEEFAYVGDSNGLHFEVRAVARPAFWGSRLVPAAARHVQRRATQRYLRAAAALAGRP